MLRNSCFVLVSALLLTPSMVMAAESSQTTTPQKVADAQGATTAQVEINQDITTLISPRTGIRYSLGKVGSRQVILQTPVLAAANINTVQRIVASNPALSVTSQEKAKQALLSATLDPNR